MKTKELVGYLKEDYDLRHSYDKKMRDRIIKKLKELEELRQKVEDLENVMYDASR